MSFLRKTASSFGNFSRRWVPGSFVIACLLTFVTILSALLTTPSSFSDVVTYWGDGFWILLKFGMQMCLIVLTGSIIADSPSIRKALDALAGAAKSDAGAVALTAGVSMVLCWVHWGLGLIASAFFARSVARRRPNVDYCLLVSAGYFGMGAVWHAGLSGSATLLVATPQHFLEDQIGVIPTSETIFNPFNLGLTFATFIALLVFAYYAHPKKEDAKLLKGEARSAVLEEDNVEDKPSFESPWLRFVEGGYFLCALFGLLCAGYLTAEYFAGKLDWTLDNLNFLFLCAAILLHPSPRSFVKAAEKAAGYCHGIILQFPIYAGMFGVIKGSGLEQAAARAFVSLASERTFPLMVYWYSGLLNYFVPSGGSQWAISAPYLLSASKALGVPYAKTVIAFCWGDMVTNSIQPFWCIPLLAVARLDFKDILGYQLLAFLLCGLIGTVGFLFI